MGPENLAFYELLRDADAVGPHMLSEEQVFSLPSVFLCHPIQFYFFNLN